MLHLNLRKSSVALAIMFLSIAAGSGCGRNDSQRVAVWGDVTWKGKPVPYGVVYFSPDTKKGNKGPQGFALIVEGHYDSRGAKSKGCVTGPLVAVVQGCSGEGISGTFPYGRPLFAAHELALDVPVEGGRLDLTIPDSAKPYHVAAGGDVE
jgi:hypothetical protein